MPKRSPGTLANTAHRGRLHNRECHSDGLLIWIPPARRCCHICTFSAQVPTRLWHRPCSQNCPLDDSAEQPFQHCPPSWLFTFGEQLTDNTSLSANHSASTRDLHGAYTPPRQSTPHSVTHSAIKLIGSVHRVHCQQPSNIGQRPGGITVRLAESAKYHRCEKMGDEWKWKWNCLYIA